MPAAITPAAAAPVPAATAGVAGAWTTCGGLSGLGNPDRPNWPARLITPVR
jgi:hypothetical protein